jgi:ketosteroid isomerase-like protein
MVLNCAGMASPLRALVDMKMTDSLPIMAILTACFLSIWYLHPTPAAAVVEVPPGVVAPADQKIMNEIVAAFDRAEAAVQKSDLDALMDFYAKGYNYHGLKRPDVRRVWGEVFMHYEGLTSKHVFTELKLVKDGAVRKAYVTCTGGLYGTVKETGKPITIDSWVQEVHHLVKEKGGWKFLGNARATAPSAPPTSAPHHPLF